MDYKRLINERKSVRKYKKHLVSKKILDEIVEFSQNCERLVEDIEIDSFIMDKDDVYMQLYNIAGYMGKMIEAPHYLIFLSEENENSLVNTGYIIEHTVLKALDLGVSSCWITLPESDKVKNALKIKDTKVVTAVIALGYEAKTKRTINILKQGDGYGGADVDMIENESSNRLSIEELVYINEWGNKADYDYLKMRGLAEAIYYARQAPSTLNRQPWRYIVDESMLILTIRDDIDTNRYEERIDAGIQMFYLELIIERTIMEIDWILGKPEKEYIIPKEYYIAGYCKI